MKKHKTLLISLVLILSLVYLFFGISMNNIKYILMRRGSRLIAIYVVSYLVNTSTVYFQSMTNNRILTPSLLGYDRLYMLIQVVVVMILKQYISNISLFLVCVIVMTLFSTVLYSTILKKVNGDLYILLLIGTLVGTFFGSITSYLQLMMDPNEFSIIQNQGFASFNAINVNVLGLACLLVLPTLVLQAYLSKSHDVVALGQNHAKNLGVNLGRFYKGALILISIDISIATALVGPISFLGLLTTNLGKEIEPSYRSKDLIFTSTFVSICLLLFAQIVFERIFKFNTSITVIINILGGIVFIWLMFKERFND